MSVKNSLKKKKREKNDIIKIPSGSYNMNMAGSGCYDFCFESKRVLEIYGEQQSGKSTIAWHIMNEAHKIYNKLGIKTDIIIIDAEYKLDETYLQRVIKKENYQLERENVCEEIFDKIFEKIEEGHRLFIIDSVGNMTSNEVIKRGFKKMGFTSIGKEMGQFFRIYGGEIYKKNCFIIFVNHLRQKIGVVFGSNETTTGGKKLGESSSYRIKVKINRGNKKKSKTKDLSKKNIKIEDDLEIGNDIKFVFTKNNTFSPFREGIIPIDYGYGINYLEDLFIFLEKISFLKKEKKNYSVYRHKDRVTESKIKKELENKKSTLYKSAMEYIKKYGYENEK